MTQDNLEKMCEKILSSIKQISKVISTGKWEGDSFVIYDPPYTLEILKNKILLKENGEEVVILTKNGILYSRNDSDINIVKNWCIALTSTTFKRFLIKTKEC